MSPIFGSAGRIGYIAPSTAERVAKEFYELVPEELGLLIATLPIVRISDSDVQHALDRIEKRARQLVETGAEAVFSAGIPLALAGGGEGFDTQLRERLSAATGVPCATDFGAALAAIRSIGAQKIALVTPFTVEYTTRISTALWESEIEVVAERGFGYDTQKGYGMLSTSMIDDAVRSVAGKASNIEAVYVPCGRIGSVRGLKDLEAELGIPVITANQILIWWSLNITGLAPTSDTGGALLNGLSEGSKSPIEFSDPRRMAPTRRLTC
ncbi:hypothetical protein E3O06_06680 [Cryobacterium glaciale]|uniref:Arylmalonate decarboxylase n=1 Tax=Cryobacterium glaciale TaxID=1259145 RepID=A0A4R8V1B1_9MICO|nr:hypothetical protein [Cryobacterium glaciale]TFB75014.1 hypothetical protein E3O06_06680 [Cryobacterium glaciale]